MADEADEADEADAPVVPPAPMAVAGAPLEAWEYAYVEGATYDVGKITVILNDLGTVGWELVSTHSADRTIGVNSTTALLRRRIMPLPPPRGSIEQGWYPDPSGRWHARYWNGIAWSFSVTRQDDPDVKRDSPTRLPPTQGLVQ